jgi:hypothetical protein
MWMGGPTFGKGRCNIPGLDLRPNHRKPIIISLTTHAAVCKQKAGG